MSKLSDFQIMALVRGGLRDPRKLLAYKDELLARAKTGQLDRSLLQQVLSFQQTDLEKPVTFDRSREDMDQTKNALTIAGERLEAHQAEAAETLLELGAWLGRGQAFGMMGAKASAAQAQCLKRIRDGAEYKALGLTWEQFCTQRIGIDRKTAERIIASLEEFGSAYFNLASVMRISPSSYRLIAGAVDETTIEIDGEKISITKTNASRISEAVESLRKTMEAKDERLAEHKRDADKLRSERNAAQKAAEKARAEFIEYKRKLAERFPGAGEDFSLLLDAQSLFDLAMAKLTSAGRRELGEEDQARYIGVTEYMYRELLQLTHAAREKWGVGWNMADPADLLALDQVAPGPRNLIKEHAKK